MFAYIHCLKARGFTLKKRNVNIIDVIDTKNDIRVYSKIDNYIL